MLCGMIGAGGGCVVIGDGWIVCGVFGGDGADNDFNSGVGDLKHQ